MSVYIVYTRQIDEFLFKMCIRHYTKTNLNFNIKVEDDDLSYFKNKYNNLLYLMNKKYFAENSIKVTEKDYLFSYRKDENDNMILSYDIDKNFVNTSVCIGKVFYVPVANSPKYTTFEIPDFIIYGHEDHNNYKKEGLKLNGGDQVSKNIVCLNLNISSVSSETQYYENHVLFCDTGSFREIIGRNVNLTYPMNIIINKEKKYGIVWYSKCGCTTIANIFCKVNNIDIAKENRRSLNFHKTNYRYNVYLQNIEYISFVRNPYYRFISSFVDKNVDHTDEIFLQIEGYVSYIKAYMVDTMNNLADFLLKGGYITEHYKLLTDNDANHIDSKVCKIEDNLNERLLEFLNNYHDNLDMNFIKTCRENINSHIKDTEDIKEIKDENMDKYDFINYTKLDWLNYFTNNKLEYNKLLQNTKLKELIYKVYKKDFIKFKYEP